MTAGPRGEGRRFDLGISGPAIGEVAARNANSWCSTASRSRRLSLRAVLICASKQSHKLISSLTLAMMCCCSASGDRGIGRDRILSRLSPGFPAPYALLTSSARPPIGAMRQRRSQGDSPVSVGQSCHEGQGRTGAACVIAGAFTPDPGAGENARRDNGQGNRGFNRCQSQHDQGASEEACRSALPGAGGQGTRRALHDHVATAILPGNRE